MSGIGSTLRRYWIEGAWAVFAAVNVAFIALVSEWETIPFHFVWVSLTLVYGIRLWRLGTTTAVLGAVMLATGVALAFAVAEEGGPGIDELSEVPLMAAMFVAMVWHATRRQHALEEVERLASERERMLSRQHDFVRDASHVLRTPIAVARGHAELAGSNAGDPQVRADTDVVVEELDRMSVISDQLLLLAASEHPDLLELERVDIGRFIRDMVRRWHAAADRRWEQQVTCEGTVAADVERLRTAVDALVENALRFTRAGDRIALGVGCSGASAVFEVTDAGQGIPPDRLANVFDRFASDPSRGAATDEHVGTGIGLAIVKAIADAHGGSVEVQSVAGKGATFRIRLPGFLARGDEIVVVPDANHGVVDGVTAKDAATAGGSIPSSDDPAADPSGGES
jgi:signal transduction histidine kinase